MKKDRIIGSLTTLPGRFNQLQRTIKSILSQYLKLDALYIIYHIKL